MIDISIHCRESVSSLLHSKGTLDTTTAKQEEVSVRIRSANFIACKYSKGAIYCLEAMKGFLFGGCVLLTWWFVYTSMEKNMFFNKVDSCMIGGVCCSKRESGVKNVSIAKAD